MKRLSVPLVLLLLTCGHPPGKQAGETSEVRVPVTLLVEKQLADDVLGSPLVSPSGLAIASDGTVFISDAADSRLIRLNPDLSPAMETGGYGFSAGLFNRPSFVAVDNALSVIVSDEGNRRVVRYNFKLNFVDEIVLEDDQDPFKYGSPSGVALNEYGDVWVADRKKNRIAVFDNVNRFDRFVGDFGYAGGQLASPEKIICDEEGNFIVCDAGNSRLVTYDAYGNFLRETTDQTLDYPIAAAVDKEFLWVLDGVSGKIVLFDRNGRYLYEAGPGLLGASEPLKEPSDIVVSADGRLLISDTGNSRLLVVRIIYDDQ